MGVQEFEEFGWDAMGVSTNFMGVQEFLQEFPCTQMLSSALRLANGTSVDKGFR